jgi:hypothetical protein
MTDSRQHRGLHPEDSRLFPADAIPTLRRAGEEVVWLVSRGYPQESAVTFVGGHHQLASRQRLALLRACCSEDARGRRRAHEVAPGDAHGAPVSIDALNLIIALEVALSGGLLFRGYDGTLRDLAGLRGTYRLVSETESAIAIAFVGLERLGVGRAEWLFDAPVSNSGRLRARVEEHARGRPFPVETSVVPNPDPLLADRAFVVTSDSWILDRCASWLNLASWLVASFVPRARVVALFDAEAHGAVPGAPSGEPDA